MRRGLRSWTVAVALSALGSFACGSAPGDAGDGGAGDGAPVGHKTFDSGAPVDAAAEAKAPWNRMTPHGGVVLSSPHIWAIYVGTQGVDLSPSYDAYLSWLVTSTDWWSLLDQYGVHYGVLDGSTIIDTATFFPQGMISSSGTVNWYALDQRVEKIIHALPPPPQDDGGVADAGAADDGGDAGDGSTTTLPSIPKADGYIVFLPDGVNVDLGGEGMTCQNVGGYHSYDGTEPYSIIPPCRYRISVSHEIAEMVTDPLPGQGWYSDGDINNGGGEIGDLCNWLTYASNQQVTALWSNKDGDCEPP
jgi:hypothetical protein